MPFNYRPKNEADITSLSFSKPIEKDLLGLLNRMMKSYKNKDEFITMDLAKPGSLKILRDFKDMIDLADLKKEFKNLSIAGVGNGTPPKASGPTTQQQELVTLKIFEELLSSSRPNYKEFNEMLPVLKELYPELTIGTDWYKSFDLQFREIKATTKLPNNKFKVYNRDSGFMDYITDLVKGFGISKKDSWNPADIWLIETGRVQQNYEKLLNEAVNVVEVNDILKDAFNKNKIVGVSLKKNNGKQLHYELVNLKSNYKLPDVDIDTYKINLTFDKKTKSFLGVTSNLWIQSNGKKYNMGVKSNQSGIGNITYEFSGSGDAAMLGKVPKDMLTATLKDFGFDMPQHSHFQSLEKNDIKTWEDKVKVIKRSNIFTFTGELDDFVDNMILSWSKGKSKDNAVVSQIMQFAYILATLDKKKKLKEIIHDFFYMAQKKGKKFGPFGKLS